MRRLYLTIRLIAPSDATVLIRGEPGTGRELVAAAEPLGVSPRILRYRIKRLGIDR